MPSTDAEGGSGVHEPSEPPAKTAEGKSSASLLKGASGAGVTTFAVTLLIILRVFALAQWRWDTAGAIMARSEEHTSELQSRFDLVCRLLLEKKKKKSTDRTCGRR